MDVILEEKLYYIPIYCYRHFPSEKDIYESIIKDLATYGKIQLYTSFDLAKEEALKLLCDDDTCTVAILDFTLGWCQAYYRYDKNDSMIHLYDLNRWKKCYEIVK